MTRQERFLFALAFLNFVVFVGVTFALGGDAINGTSGDGHYYLGSHGKYTEVSQGVFRYSEAHTLSLFITHPVGIVVAIRARRRFRKRPS